MDSENFSRGAANNMIFVHNFQIQVTAENKGSEIVRLTGGQLHLYDDSNKRYSPTFAGYGDSELSLIDLEPQKAVTLTTQFDIDYDPNHINIVGISNHDSLMSLPVPLYYSLNNWIPKDVELVEKRMINFLTDSNENNISIKSLKLNFSDEILENNHEILILEIPSFNFSSNGLDQFFLLDHS